MRHDRQNAKRHVPENNHALPERTRAKLRRSRRIEINRRHKAR